MESEIRLQLEEVFYNFFETTYHRHTHNYPAAEADLEEVLDIAEPSGMRLHLTDYHLEMARLRLAQARPVDARPHVGEAARLIGETGYHRRDKELEELQRALSEGGTEALP